MMESCSNCQWWDAMASPVTTRMDKSGPGTPNIGVCRNQPPVPLRSLTGEPLSVQPETHRDCRCSFWAEVEDPDPDPDGGETVVQLRPAA